MGGLQPQVGTLTSGAYLIPCLFYLILDSIILGAIIIFQFSDVPISIPPPVHYIVFFRLSFNPISHWGGGHMAPPRKLCIREKNYATLSSILLGTF